MDFPPDPSVSPLDSAEEEVTSYLKMRTAFNQTKHQHKWLVSHLTFSEKYTYYILTLCREKQGK